MILYGCCVRYVVCGCVAVSWQLARDLQVPSSAIRDSSKSDDVVWIDQRRFKRQARRHILGWRT